MSTAKNQLVEKLEGYGVSTIFFSSRYCRGSTTKSQKPMDTSFTNKGFGMTQLGLKPKVYQLRSWRTTNSLSRREITTFWMNIAEALDGLNRPRSLVQFKCYAMQVLDIKYVTNVPNIASTLHVDCIEIIHKQRNRPTCSIWLRKAKFCLLIFFIANLCFVSLWRTR